MTRKTKESTRFQHWRALLTPEQVKHVRRTYKRGKATQAQLAGAFGVSQAAISNLLTGKTYRTV